MPSWPRGERDLTCSPSACKHYIQGQECGRREPCFPIWGWLRAALGSSPSSPTLWLWGLGKCCYVSEPCFPHL